MLELKKINKVYNPNSFSVHALKDINLNFRNEEFVSILGTSGSGKTTLLNIIGGLDDYTSGDLIINGVSTKKYKDKNWDSYRNHSVGFVFQSYNLISHQTALANVELALTISGVSKNKRRKRAIEALKEVGLKDQINKKPNQMSGGQMQRVAIARALVNDPEILLADEPTGALDSKTSIQIMEILKKISTKRLVIMVTHNPDLAEKYSTRIIKLSDGNVIDDTNPYEKIENKNEIKNNNQKTSMSFFTALNLSLNNLITKKGRTILTSFAGAIGIIGIALIMSISNGVNQYIKSVEEDTLSSYPISIEEKQVDGTSLLESMKNSDEAVNIEEETIVTNDIMGNMLNIMSREIEKNDLKSFKKYLENNNEINDYSNAVQYSYNLNLQIYENNLKKVNKLNPSDLFENFGYSISDIYSSMMTNVFSELIDNEELINSQYEVLSGHMPENYDEVILVVDGNNQISDYTAYSIGLKDKSELESVIAKMASGEEINFERGSYKYDDILNLKFKVLLNTDYYEKSGNIWINHENDEEYILEKLKNALEIKIVGIVKINDSSVLSSSSSYGGIMYTKDLTNYVVDKINQTKIAKEQLENPEINVLTGLKFSTKTFDINNLTNEEKKKIASLSSEELASFISSYNNSSYETNLINLGIVDLESPSKINIYPKDFASKEKIKEYIDKYNENKEENEKISYTDYVGLLMSSVTTIVDVISYVLIAFVSVSLIVSSIMIGIITYISVLERTKEIGILRSIGASKKDISRVFNAETFIIGSISGLIGIAVTFILNIPINAIISNLTNIESISSLPIINALVLVGISIFLTLVAGLIPSRVASKKDPVEALRSE